MGWLKKTVLILVALLLLGGGYVYFKYGQDDYDPSKYSATITSPADKDDAPHRDTGSASPSDEEGSAEAPFVGLAQGSKVELTLPDQFDESHTLGPEVEVLILALSKKAGDTARGFLDEQEENFLSAHRAVVIVDISPIPVVIRNSMVLPALKKRSFPFLLVYEEKIGKALQSKRDRSEVAVALIEDNVVQEIRYASDRASLGAAIP